MIVIPCNRIKEIRARHGVTQEQLASYLHMKVSNFRKKEKELAQFKQQEMHLITLFFNTNYNENFTLEDLFYYELIEE